MDIRELSDKQFKIPMDSSGTQFMLHVVYRLLARWASRRPEDGQLHVFEKIVHLSRPFSTFWMPTFQILAKLSLAV